MTTKQEIAELKETIRRLTERIEQLEARQQVFTPYAPMPYPIYIDPNPQPRTPPAPVYTSPSTADRPYWLDLPKVFNLTNE